METLNVHLENCFGIRKLEHPFSFQEGHVNLIYASNGSMKTSFAKVFAKFQHGREQEIRDYIFDVPVEQVVKDIQIDGSPIRAEEIFVIKSFDDSYHSQNISALLLREDLKKEYESLTKDLQVRENDFFAHLKKYFQYTKQADDDLAKPDLDAINETANVRRLKYEIIEVFGGDLKNKLEFYRVLEAVSEDVNRPEDTGSAKIKYGILFNPKILGVLTKGSASLLAQYVDRYIKIIEQSKYFTLKFNHQSAEAALKELQKAHYFETGRDGNENEFELVNKTADTHDRMGREAFENEVKRIKLDIIKDPLHAKLFEDLDKKLGSTKLTKKFRDCLLESVDIGLLGLFKRENDPNFYEPRKRLILAYLRDSRDVFNQFTNEFREIQSKIDDLLKRVKEDDSTLWYSSVNEFNDRFTVPFKVCIDQEDKEMSFLDPEYNLQLKYRFCQLCGIRINSGYCTHSPLREKDEEDLLKSGDSTDGPILSQGERRAFYLLNIIFEVKHRKKQGLKTVFIVDDIADSFDYQNKYAIVEYLQEMSEVENFYLIILTHNFDFFRTLNQRLYNNQHENWAYLTEKDDSSGKITLISYNDNWREPFKNWQQQLGSDPKYILALMPAIRELFLVVGRNGEDAKKMYDELNNILHGRSNSGNLQLSEIKPIFSHFYGVTLDFPPGCEEKTIDTVFTEVSEKIVTEGLRGLEDKVVLALSARRTTEIFLRARLGENGQLPKLISSYKQKVGEDAVYRLVKRVNIITPENIHINSFMYEPIIDLDIKQTVDLYREVNENLVDLK